MTRVHGNQIAGPGMLDFAVSVWPLQRPAEMTTAMHAALDESGYPDETVAREAVARRHGLDPSQVLLANGASEIFWTLAQALRPRRAMCVEPSFTETRAALAAVGAEIATLARTPPDWSLDDVSVPGDIELVIVGNPNSPTGGLDPAAHIQELTGPGRLVVVDESFMEFAEDRRQSLCGSVSSDLAVVRSETKLWGLAGVRAGYLLAAPPLVERLEAARQPWPVNAAALAALNYTADDVTTAAAVSREVAIERERLTAVLADLDIEVYDSAVNFVLVRVDDGPALTESLRERGVAVRPAGDFQTLTDEYVRIAIRPRADNDLLIDALSEALVRC